MWLFFKQIKKQRRNRRSKKKATTRTNKSQQLNSWNTCRWCFGGGDVSPGGADGAEEGTTTKTKVAVSFTVYSSTPEMWYKAILSVRAVLSFLRGVEKYKSQLCFCKLQRGLVWLEEDGRVLFLHFTETYIIFLLPVKPKVFSTGSVVLVMAKKWKKKKSKRKNLVVPDMAM